MTNSHGARDHNRVKLTPSFVLNAKPPGKDAKGDRIIYWDLKQPGFGLMVTQAGAKSFVVQYRAKGIGVSRRKSWPAGEGGFSLDKARRQASIVRGDALRGVDTLAEERKSSATAADAKANTLQAIANEFLDRQGGKLRSIKQRRAALERLVYPKLGDRPITEIKRKEITKLLDKIEKGSGPVMADRALAYIRKIMNWHAVRDEDYQSPIVRGMARTKPKERARKRTLTDDELRAIWKAADAFPGPFGRYVQFLLLTSSRRNEAAHMRRNEVSGSDWTIPPVRYKTGLELVVPLSPAAVDVLDKLPKIGNAGFVFTSDGKRPLGGFSKFKREFDNQCGVSDWRLHDLRRTARSLMSRAGVPSDHAERALGHVIAGVRGVYDRYEFYEEKKRAFEALASLVARILDPKANVVAMKKRARQHKDR